ncbi:MAG: ribonuclease III [Candidatus Puniceispirillaceae bacterium]
MTDFDNKPELADKLENLPEIAQAEYLIDYPFKDKALLHCALTHSSIAPDPSKSYERLEFFGDRILGMVLSDWLYQAFPQADQGELTHRFHALARQEYLAGICTKLEMQNCLLHEKGSKRLAERPSVQADLIESIIAALYLDGGLAAAASFIKSHWQVKEAIPDVLAENPKSALQEWAAAQKIPLPAYQLVSQTGSDHEPEFCVRVQLAGFPAETATGRSRKTAERAAAALFLKTHILQDKA